MKTQFRLTSNKRRTPGFGPLHVYEGNQSYGHVHIDFAQPQFKCLSLNSDNYKALPHAWGIRGSLIIVAEYSAEELLGWDYKRLSERSKWLKDPTKGHPDLDLRPNIDLILPEGLEVFGNAHLGFGQLQERTHIHGDLILTGNRNMTHLPHDLKVDGCLDLTGCNIMDVPWQVAEHIREHGGEIIGIHQSFVQDTPAEVIQGSIAQTTHARSIDPNQMTFGWN